MNPHAHMRSLPQARALGPFVALGASVPFGRPGGH